MLSRASVGKTAKTLSIAMCSCAGKPSLVHLQQACIRLMSTEREMVVSGSFLVRVWCNSGLFLVCVWLVSSLFLVVFCFVRQLLQGSYTVRLAKACNFLLTLPQRASCWLQRHRSQKPEPVPLVPVQSSSPCRNYNEYCTCHTTQHTYIAYCTQV